MWYVDCRTNRETPKRRCEMNRKKLLIAAACLALSAAAPGFAGAGTVIRAEVPFAFYAGKLLLPAGSYVITVDEPGEPGLLTIQDRKGKEHELLLTVPEHRRPGATSESKLVFDRYGRDNFLSQVWVVGLDEGRAVPKSEVERERAVLLRHEGASVGVAGHTGEN
jgi:hypothetical protein